MNHLQRILQLEQPEGEEATRLRAWLILVNSILIVVSLFFTILWQFLGQNNFAVPTIFQSILTLLGYSVSLWLVWQGRIWQGALLVVSLFILATTFTFWMMPDFSNLVISLYVISLIFASTFLNKPIVKLCAAFSFFSFTLLSFSKFLDNLIFIDLDLLFISRYFLGVVVLVLAYALILSNMKMNEIRSDAALKSEARYRLLFEASPIALWEQDGSMVMAKIEELREAGVQDFRTYFEQHPDVVFEIIGKIKVTDVNETAVSMYKAKNKAELMDNLDRFIPEESYSFVLDSLEAMAARKPFFEREITSLTLEGKKLTVLYRWAIPAGQEDVYTPVIASIVDVTARKQIEDVLQSYSERLRGLHELDLAINVKQSPEEISEVALGFVMQFVPAWGAEVWAYDEEGQTVSLLAATKVDEAEDGAVHDPLQPSVSLLSEEMQDDMRNNQAYVVDDLRALRYLPPVLMSLKKLGVRSFIQMPLLVRGESVGFLNIFDKEVNTYIPEFLGIVREISAPLSIALGNVQLLVAENTARNQAETLRRVAAQLNASLKLTPLLEQILEYLEDVIPYDSATIFLENEGVLKVMAQRGLPEDVNYEYFEASSSRLGASPVFLEGKPHIIYDTRVDRNWRVLTGLEYIRCWMGIPLQVKGKTIGVLTLDKSVARFYTETNQELAVAFANQAAVAIENARLYEQTRQYADDLEVRVDGRMRDLSTLYEITAVANKHIELEKILDESLGILLNTLNSYAGTIYILDEEGNFCAKSQMGAPDILQPTISPHNSENNLLQRILDMDAPLIVRDIATSPILATLTTSTDILSYAGVALRVKDDVVGILSIVNKENTQFSMEDIALLASVADHFGVIVENGRLRQQNENVAVLHERERLARELHDSVSQSLYSLTLFAEASRDLLKIGNGEKLREYLDDIGTTAQQALKEMRLMLYELRSSTLGEEGLVNALRYRLEAVEGRSGMDANIEAQLDIDIPHELRRTLYLIAQEALNNTLKHAKATEVFVTLNMQGSNLIMTIEDNGQGFSSRSTHIGGLGMNTMRERIEDAGGNFLIRSLPGVGTKIEISIDLEKQGVA